ncbi:hypothetical protein E2C01_089187 [Portunus trituberculatus]|uniref:Uncharacterized protein n=1 Tax=Portunus trituberculatus TaxID=210409 RepID=A0A5B7JIE9_PORTR|nr:hypothetical protein [Portunus trituberculatus]
MAAAGFICTYIPLVIRYSAWQNCYSIKRRGEANAGSSDHSYGCCDCSFGSIKHLSGVSQSRVSSRSYSRVQCFADSTEAAQTCHANSIPPGDSDN